MTTDRDPADSATMLVDGGYLEAMLAAAPPEPAISPRALGRGTVASAGYVRRVVAAALEERQSRLEAGHP